MKIILNSTSSDPNYLQIENQIKDLIYQGQLKPHDQLPSIRLLAHQLNVAIITVKRAYDDLEREGIIETRQGKGCFIKASDSKSLEKQLEEEFKRKMNEMIQSGIQRGLKKEKIERIMREIMSEEVKKSEE